MNSGRDKRCPPFSEIQGQEIDYIKIDVEGFEYEVLVGAAKTITAHRPKFIQMEFNWHQLFKARPLYAFAELLPGYGLYQLLPHRAGFHKIDPKSPEDNIFIFANFVFAREDLSI